LPGSPVTLFARRLVSWWLQQAPAEHFVDVVALNRSSHGLNAPNHIGSVAGSGKNVVLMKFDNQDR
jgi:hypothetical protein